MTTTTATLPNPAVTAASPSIPRSLAPLAIDIAVPTAVYYLARDGLHAGTIDALILSGVTPLARTIWAWARRHSVNGLAALAVSVDIAGVALSLVSGNARLIYAKSSGVSSVIAVGILVSVLQGRPLMSAGIRPFITRGDAGREHAWDRLSAGSAAFAGYERRYTAVWGVSLLADCVARVVCAFTVPLAVLSWLSPAILISAIAVATIVGGGAAVGPLSSLIDAELETS
ncbi:MAG TPA: VC0807 family protein [Solirubrobacteraceae bacterium]